MRNTMWRLTALAGMLGLGLLFVFQAKQGWKNPLAGTPIADSERGEGDDTSGNPADSPDFGQSEPTESGRPNPFSEEDDPFANSGSRTPSVVRGQRPTVPEDDIFLQSEPPAEQAPTSVPVRRPRRSAAVEVESDPFVFAETGGGDAGRVMEDAFVGQEEPVDDPFANPVEATPAEASPPAVRTAAAEEFSPEELGADEFAEEDFDPATMESAAPVVAALAGADEPVKPSANTPREPARPNGAYSRRKNPLAHSEEAISDPNRELAATAESEEVAVRVPFDEMLKTADAKDGKNAANNAEMIAGAEERPVRVPFDEMLEQSHPLKTAAAENPGNTVTQTGGVVVAQNDSDSFALEESPFESGEGTVSDEDAALFPDDAQTPKTKPAAPAREPRPLPVGNAGEIPIKIPGEGAPLINRGPPERFSVEPGAPANPLPGAEPRTAASISGDSAGNLAEDSVETPPAARSSQQRPRLTIEKVAPQNAVLGQPLVYRIMVKNVGTSPARQVIVEDEIPEGVKLTGTIPRAELAGKRLVWRLGTVEPNTDRTILIRVVPTSEGEIGSVATVNFVAEVASQTRITAPKLKLTLTAQPQVALGEEIVVNFTVTNSGTGDASKVVIRNLLPAALEHPGGDDLEYAVGDLPSGEKREVELSLKAVQPGSIINRATVTADGDVNEEAEIEILVVGSQLVVQRTGPLQQYLNRNGQFTNVVTNEGKQPATGVILVETLGSGFEFAQASTGGVYDPERGTVTWQLGTIPAGKSVKTIVSLTSREVGAQSTEVVVTDSTGGESRATSSTQVQGIPALTVQVVEMAMPVAVGEQFACKVTLKNRGSDVAQNAVLNLVLPAELKLVDAKGATGHRLNGNRVQFEAIESMEAGEALEFNLTLQATAAGDSRLSIQYQASHMQKPLTREEGVFVVAGSR